MGWRSAGSSFPGGAALERGASALDAAATDFGDVLESMADRLDEVETALGQLNDRVDRIEDGSMGRGSRVP